MIATHKTAGTLGYKTHRTGVLRLLPLQQKAHCTASIVKKGGGNGLGRSVLGKL